MRTSRTSNVAACKIKKYNTLRYDFRVVNFIMLNLKNYTHFMGTSIVLSIEFLIVMQFLLIYWVFLLLTILLTT